MDNTLGEFKNYLIAERSLAKNSVNGYLLHTKKFLEFIQKKPAEIEKSDCISFVASLKNKEVSTSTLAIKVISIRAFLNYIGKNYMDNFRIPKIQRKEILVLGREKVEQIFSGLQNQKYKVLLSLLYFGGLRVSEAINIKISHINLKNNKIEVKRKRNKIENIRIPEKTKERIRNWIINKDLSENDYLIYGRNKRTPISRQGINKKIRHIGNKFGIDHLHAHTFRHSIATEMAKNNINIAVIQQFLGHDDISTTQKYLHLSKNDVNEAFDKLSINF